MPPKITTFETWSQADLLMQPALIRLLDNLRKIAEDQNWQATYNNQLLWPDGTTEAQKADYDRLQQELSRAAPETVPGIEAQLAQLPQPQLYYGLLLSQGERSASFDIWQLCYQICFVDYNEDNPVAIDATLLDGDVVDWDQLEQKTKTIVLDLFGRLPS
jgi:hypothetical protein